jgi:predicted ester cyclase
VTNDPKSFLTQIYEAINRRDLSALDAVIATDVVDHTPMPGQKPGLEGIKGAWAKLHTNFPEMRIVPQDVVAEDERVAARVVFEDILPGGVGRMSRGTMMEFVRVSQGKVTDAWNLIHFD